MSGAHNVSAGSFRSREKPWNDMNLTNQNYAAINRALEKIYAIQDLEGFIVTTMQELPCLMNSDMAAYNEVDYDARRTTTVIDSPFGQSHWHKVQLVFERIMNQNPLIEHSTRARGTPKKISDFLSSEEWHNTGIYQTVYRDISGQHQMAVALPLEDTNIVAFAFNRKKSDFTERERAILAVLQPHLTRAYRNARQHTLMSARLERNEEALERIGAGWIEVDRNCRIVKATALARANLATFFERKRPDDDRLPPSVETWVAGRSKAGVKPPPLVFNAEAEKLIIRFLSNEPEGGCCLLTERFPEATSPKPLECMGLTERQAEVLFWICQGKSNPEIAVILKISGRTVTFHVSRILETLNVANRTEAVNVATKQLTSGR